MKPQNQELKLVGQAGHIEALVFDMDGVIVDSEPLHLRAYQELFEPLGIDFGDEENKQFLGRKDIELADILIERYGLDMSPQELVDRKESNLNRLLRSEATLRPGVVALLEEARRLGVPAVVASSATLPTICLVVEVLGLSQYFRHLNSGDEVPNGKPAPDVFLLAAQRLGIEPQKCLVIEDTLNGIRAAKAANMWCLSVPCETTRHQDHSLADMHLDSLECLKLGDLVACAPGAEKD